MMENKLDDQGQSDAGIPYWYKRVLAGNIRICECPVETMNQDQYEHDKRYRNKGLQPDLIVPANTCQSLDSQFLCLATAWPFLDLQGAYPTESLHNILIKRSGTPATFVLFVVTKLAWFSIPRVVSDPVHFKLTRIPLCICDIKF